MRRVGGTRRLRAPSIPARELSAKAAPERIAARQIVSNAAYAEHPERFVRRWPKALQLAPASYINRPTPTPAEPAITEDIQSPEVKAAA